MKKTLVLPTIEGILPEIGRWLSAYDDARQRTLRMLDDVDAKLVDAPDAHGATVGALLYHLAAIEASWLFDEVLGNQWPHDFGELFPWDVRDGEGHLTPIQGETLAVHLARLADVHERLHAAYRAMTLQEFHALRSTPDYDVTPIYVLHHLMQHEGEHRSQLDQILQDVG